MICLNEQNGADKICAKYEKKCLVEFEGPLYAAVMGIAYGGDVERIARDIWGNRGKVYGFDTFESLHPRHLAEDVQSFEATCMDHWYLYYGTDQLTYEYQRKQLDDQGLTNAILVKGEVNKDSCKDIPYLNYAFLDMDILASMQAGYAAVADKIVKGGYLLMHDVVNNIPSLMEWYQKDIKLHWQVMEEGCLTGVLRKK